ncbi:MAG: TetR/AcrR family transcriptional regulator [Alphaproteobacteria bacterium]|nr:TetR/AcrR family transcriptional regulator [Alphaproteobacteria bacterium]
MSRRERNKADTRERVFGAARELFAEHGFDRTTVRQIAERAEVGTGTVLLHGGSKTGLLVELWTDELQRVIDRQAATLPQDASLLDELVHLLGAFFELYAAHPELSRVYVQHTLLLPHEELRTYDQMTTGFLELVAGRVHAHRGELDPRIDEGTVAMSAFGLYLVHVSAFLRSPVDPGPAVAVLRDTLQRWLAPILR